VAGQTEFGCSRPPESRFLPGNNQSPWRHKRENG
jgi:hypothetical protein